jgi:alanyl-tRNA synthetase
VSNVWKKIADDLSLSVEELKKALAPMRDIMIILDHTRAIYLTVCDGSLPSNNGGAGNLRRIVRRVFSLMKHNNWWEKLSF